MKTVLDDKVYIFLKVTCNHTTKKKLEIFNNLFHLNHILEFNLVENLVENHICSTAFKLNLIHYDVLTNVNNVIHNR